MLARRRMVAGVYGRRNTGWRMLLGGFLPDATAGRTLLRGIFIWLKAEWQNLFLPRARQEAQTHLRVEMSPDAQS
jgi:hypothetical protein